MRIVKRLDLFVLEKFLVIFFGSFFITLFVYMMQFTWRYVDELIGKGLTLDILAEFYWYMSLTLVPNSLPLAILLASLISFGNMGERLELLAIRAAGVSLFRTMLPGILLSAGFAVMSFHFMNKIAPESQLKLRTLLYSMKLTSPALEIPEGQFYNGVPGLNFFVKEKEVSTGKLYDVMIYKTDQGFEKAQIVVADSARLEMTTDRLHLVLDLWGGEQFENLQGAGADQLGRLYKPYDRETFGYKRFLIDFDSNFEKMDEDQLRTMATAMNLQELDAGIDSINTMLDSISHGYYLQASERYFPRPQLPAAQENRLKTAFRSAAERSEKAEAAVNFDSLVARQTPERMQQARSAARAHIEGFRSELEWKSVVIEDGDYFARRYRIEWHTKFARAVSCLLFFLIGAPLGAIIRKGGLGMPAVVSVIVFVIYYSIDTSGMKMARDGSWNLYYGMWVSTCVLAPTGIWLTYKSNNDSVVFNIDTYLSALVRFIGIPTERHIARKEVIIHTPDYEAATAACEQLASDIRRYEKRAHLKAAPSYVRLFFSSHKDEVMASVCERLEALVEELGNTRDDQLLHELNQLPVPYARAHTLSSLHPRLRQACGIVVPVGLILWGRCWRFRLRLYRDLRQTERTLMRLRGRIQTIKE